MNYCAMNEAFNTTLKKQNSNNNIIPPDTFDNYNDINTNNNIFPAFFTAQGDYANKGPYYGTDVEDLKNNTIVEESDGLSFLDNNLIGPVLAFLLKSSFANFLNNRNWPDGRDGRSRKNKPQPPKQSKTQPTRQKDDKFPQ